MCGCLIYDKDIITIEKGWTNKLVVIGKYDIHMISYNLAMSDKVEDYIS